MTWRILAALGVPLAEAEFPEIESGELTGVLERDLVAR